MTAIPAGWIDADTVELVAPMARADCVKVLRAAIHSENARVGRGNVAGHVDDESLTIRRGRALPILPNFHPALRAQLIDDGVQTRIVCHLGRRPMMKVTTTAARICVVAGIAILALSACAAAFARHDGSAGWPFAVIPFAVASASLYFAPVNDGFLLRFLQDTIGAVPHSIEG